MFHNLSLKAVALRGQHARRKDNSNGNGVLDLPRWSFLTILSHHDPMRVGIREVHWVLSGKWSKFIRGPLSLRFDSHRYIAKAASLTDFSFWLTLVLLCISEWQKDSIKRLEADMIWFSRFKDWKRELQTSPCEQLTLQRFQTAGHHRELEIGFRSVLNPLSVYVDSLLMWCSALHYCNITVVRVVFMSICVNARLKSYLSSIEN